MFLKRIHDCSYVITRNNYVGGIWSNFWIVSPNIWKLFWKLFGKVFCIRQT